MPAATRTRSPSATSVAQPRKIITAPTWSGIESETVSYTAGYTNIHEHIPFRTLTGRAHFYQDHEWFLDFGEGFCCLQAAGRHARNTRRCRPASPSRT
jgi:nitrate reductase alpha subunit